MSLSAPSASAPSEKSAARHEAIFGALILGIVLIGLTAMTWQKWPDLIVDFGVQLYVPWQLAKGAVLYRDIAYLTGGPLSQYLDAAIFRVFGASVLTLVVTNLVILAGLLALIYRMFHRAAGQITALAVSLTILLAFAFEHYSDYGIFNYVTPYSEEIYQGLVLSVLAFSFLWRWVETPDKKYALAGGFCAGLVFLTKAEVFLALFVTFVAGAFLGWRVAANRDGVVKSEGQTGNGSAGTSPYLSKRLQVLLGLGWMAGASAVPALLFFIYFLAHGSFGQSLAWTCWAWTPLLTTDATHDPFYRWCLGLDAPWIHVNQMLHQFSWLVLILTVCAVVFRFCNRGWQAIAAWVVLAAILIKPLLSFKWEECGMCLPLVCLVMLALVLWRARKIGWHPYVVFGALWGVFSLVLMVKMGFYTRIWHYGFVLGMPATLAAIYFLLRLLPEELKKIGVPFQLWRSFVGVFLAIALLQLMLGSKFTYQKKTIPVATGADRLWTYSTNADDSTGIHVAGTVSWMQSHTPANTTVAALPAGAMLNFLLRRDNPNGYLRWNPTELAVFGQTNMNRAFEEHPPDYVLLLGVDNSEYGVRYFGDKPAFGQDLVAWIRGHYHQIGLVGSDWEQTDYFGVKIFERDNPPVASLTK